MTRIEDCLDGAECPDKSCAFVDNCPYWVKCETEPTLLPKFKFSIYLLGVE